MLSEITGIPTDRMNTKKSQIIKSLSKNLSENIIDQKPAVNTLVSAIRRNMLGLSDDNRPVGSFLFLGPTGVGKTYTVKQLAKYLFGSESMMNRFDMSDFSEQYSISRLIGSPPGYVGFEDGGLLIKSVRKNPRQILLFDEIEKANVKVFDIFLQILEEGILQGQRGEVADFRHCIIVMTSNIGSVELSKTTQMGFGETHAHTQEQVKNIVHDELVKVFRPEFINRFDETVFFNPLGITGIEKLLTE